MAASRLEAIGWYHETGPDGTVIFFYSPRRGSLMEGTSKLHGPFPCWSDAKESAIQYWQARLDYAVYQMELIKLARKPM